MGKYLCIGGVRDGQYYEGEIGEDCVIRLRQHAPPRVHSALPPAPVEQDTIERYATYRAWTFRDGYAGRTHMLLVDESIDPACVMTRLMESYARNARARREGNYRYLYCSPER